MSDTAASGEQQKYEARGHFASFLGLAYYIATWAYLWMVPPVAVSQREGLWLAAALLLISLWCIRPSFRFLWCHTDWFRVLTAALAIVSLSCMTAAIWIRSQTLLLFPFFTTFAMIAIGWPAMKKFAERFGLPDRNRS